MTTLTPIASRLLLSLDAERLHMANQWFFKWHQIGRDGPVEIESFSGSKISLGGIRFSGSARDVYWDTIQRYLRQKVESTFNDLETELQRYPIAIRLKALAEASSIVKQFATHIRHAATEKDRVLRGTGTEFPDARDIGTWIGSRSDDIDKRVDTLRLIYCDMEVANGDDRMALSGLTNARVTLVKADGTIVKEDIAATVSSGRIVTFETTLPLEPGDHFLRQLPNGLVEDFVVTNPVFYDAVGGIPANFQVHVTRSGLPAGQPQTIINNITNHVSGPNARVNINSTDNSSNVAAIPILEIAAFLDQVRPAIQGLPEPQRTAISEPLALLEDEIRSGKADHGKVRAALQSMRAIAEGATGSLIATGIQGLIDKMLSGG